jgi:hypothetical protein
MEQHQVVGLIGVYHADGGILGEARYVLGTLLGTAHCGLCDITHSPVRRKPAWDAMVRRLGIPVALLHLNEMPPDVAAAVEAHGSPAVLARRVDGALHLLLGPDQLDALAGSVDAFESAVRSTLAAERLALRSGW